MTASAHLLQLVRAHFQGNDSAFTSAAMALARAAKVPTTREAILDIIREVTTASFELDVLQASAEVPVLVDFWAPWCAPCRHLAPIVEELAGDYEGKVTFTKLNVDEAPNIAVRYGIMSIPTVMLFKNGQAVKQIVGLRPKKDFKASLDEVVS